MRCGQICLRQWMWINWIDTFHPLALRGSDSYRVRRQWFLLYLPPKSSSSIDQRLRKCLNHLLTALLAHLWLWANTLWTIQNDSNILSNRRLSWSNYMLKYMLTNRWHISITYHRCTFYNLFIYLFELLILFYWLLSYRIHDQYQIIQLFCQ